MMGHHGSRISHLFDASKYRERVVHYYRWELEKNMTYVATSFHVTYILYVLLENRQMRVKA
jgi:hypothetical protein